MSITTKAMTRGSVAAVTVIAAITLGGALLAGVPQPRPRGRSPTKTATAVRTTPSA